MSDAAAPQASETAQQASALSPQELDAFTNKLITALKTVYDPEIPVDIYELGLIYKVDVADNKDVTVDGIGEVTVNMTFDPPWTPERMSEEAKLELNMF